LGRPAAAGTTSTSIQTRRSSEKSSSTRPIIRERLEVASYIHKGLKVVFDRRDHQDKGGCSSTAEGLVEYLKKVIG
jgi:hypothetical protein